MSAHVLYPGCLISRRYPGFEAAARFVAKKLGMELVDREGFTCCPDPVWLRSARQDLWLRMAARNLAVAAGQNGDAGSLVALCNGCFETLNTALHLLKTDQKQREQVARFLESQGQTLSTCLQVKHLVQVVYETLGPEELKKHLVRPLEGLTLATHPGCHLTRPSDIARFDDPLNPRALDELVEALGARVLDYPTKSQCCGLPVFVTDRELSLSLAAEKIRAVAQADGLVVTCPSCFQQFETVQMLDRSLPRVPVFYYFELLALALGADPGEIGLDQHRIKADAVLARLGHAKSSAHGVSGARGTKPN